MKKVENNSSFNLDTLTFGELKAAMPSTANLRTPTEKQFREKEPLFIVMDGEVQVSVFPDGFVVYTRPDSNHVNRSTVFAIDRIEYINYKFGATKEEYEDFVNETEDWTFRKNKVKFAFSGNGYTRIHSVPESEFQDCFWLLPISMIGDDKLDANGNNREEYHIEYHLEDEERNEEIATPSTEEVLKARDEALEEAADMEKKLAILREAMETLTEKQRRVVKLYYYSGKVTTEAKVAKEIGTSQENVHKTLAASIKKLRKHFSKNGYCDL